MWDSKSTPFKHEAWTEYGIGVAVILLRIAARIKIVRWNWHGDDYIIILVLLLWSGELAMLELIGRTGTNIGLTDAQRAALTPEEIAMLEFGTKCNLAGWLMYTTLIWSLKSCMLFFYARLTIGLYKEKMVKIAAVVCACTYVISMITILAHCRPIEKNWQVNPDPGDICTLGIPNYLTVAPTNLLTDMLLLSIPLPLLVKVRIPLARQMVIGLLLCGGVFIMVATLLRCILSIQSINGINISTIWAIRESFVAILAINAPCIKPIFSPRAWTVTSDESSPGDSENPSSLGTGSYQLSKVSKSSRFDQLSTLRTVDDHCSEELSLPYYQAQMGIASHAPNSVCGATASTGNQSLEIEHSAHGGIQVTTTYEVTPSKPFEEGHRNEL
ncbi:hypothetical protein MGYG_00380 [Nannizzia gypsea CBS 118893]|uniref:Rhodopsin domain-containing protein n=1 Tax=Arthroderma gypseum (strain ATCC MYA-4604 / CBS 118893) TaxID=535722 RepID=E5QZH5_ARTGP|nr:hypothetical protein MGYG_00380 [Nannizzia gypsea CBS 118893]EFQ97341.1 hypothetical protein MGYG_00380 [Nannizzia gypsea CBS 118893]